MSEEKYLKECCRKAGLELEKYSFGWDGKEKNLVVQAMHLNDLYEVLTQQNKQMKKTLKYIKSITDFEQVKDLPEQRGRCIYQFKLVNSECAEALSKLGGE